MAQTVHKMSGRVGETSQSSEIAIARSTHCKPRGVIRTHNSSLKMFHVTGDDALVTCKAGAKRRVE